MRYHRKALLNLSIARVIDQTLHCRDTSWTVLALFGGKDLYKRRTLEGLVTLEDL